MQDEVIYELHVTRQFYGTLDFRLFAREENGQLVFLTSDRAGQWRTFTDAWLGVGKSACREAIQRGVYRPK
jgi:hypothetical protein